MVDAGIEEWGADRIGIRISPIGTFQNTDNGPNEEADTLYLIEQLGKRGIAYLHMSEPDWSGGEPYTDAFREKVRARFHGPIICAGAYTVEKAETLIGKGLIDAVHLVVTGLRTRIWSPACSAKLSLTHSVPKVSTVAARKAIPITRRCNPTLRAA